MGYIEIVKVLLTHGADSMLKDDYGRTALKLAAEQQQERLLIC